MHSKRYLWYPIKLIWAGKKVGNMRHGWFKKHGVHEGWDGFAMGVFSQIFHFGRLKIKLGNKDFKKKPHKQKNIPIEDR